MKPVQGDVKQGSPKARRRRRDDQKLQLRNIILQKASEMFVELGYNNFSMRKLAERVGYSSSNLYLYFRDKDDLLFTVVDEAFTLFRRQLAEAADSTADPWERLKRLGEAYVRFGLHHPAYYQLMFMWRSDYLTETRREEPPRVGAFQVLYDAVRSAVDEGVMQQGDSKIYSDILWATMHGIVALAIQMPMFDEDRTTNLINHAQQMIYNALHR